MGGQQCSAPLPHCLSNPSAHATLCVQSDEEGELQYDMMVNTYMCWAGQVQYDKVMQCTHHHHILVQLPQKFHVRHSQLRTVFHLESTAQ